MSLAIAQNAADAEDTPVVETAAAPVVDLTGEAPAPGTEEYDAWLEAKYNAEVAAQEAAEADSLILGKFKSQEDLIKAYTEAQAELTRVKQGVKTEAPKDATEAPKEAPKAGAVDRAKYAAEIASSGSLSEASYAELEAAGWDKQTVDTYIQGQHAIEAQRQSTERNAVLALVGGEDSYKTMTSWAAANLTAAEIARFDKSVSTSRESAELAVSWLHDKYKAANGNRPAVRITGGNAAASTGGFESQAQAIAAMQDKRYAKDPAYRAEVERKLASMVN